MARAARIYDFTLTAGGTFTLLVEGSYYRLLASTGAIEVRREDGSVVGPLMAGQGEQNQEFKRLTLVDKSGSNNIGTIVVADNTFVDARTTGEVSIIDGEKSRTLSGGAFSGSPFSLADPANYSVAQIWNPSTQKNLIVRLCEASSPSSLTIAFYLSTSALLTDQTSNRTANMLAGASAPVAQARSGVLATLPIYSNSLLRSVSLAANAVYLYKPSGNIVIPPNKGLSLLGTVVNTTITSNFEWFEEPV